MTWRFSYTGDLNDPKFSWDNPDDWAYRTGNLPRRVIPSEKGESLGVNVSYVMQALEEGRCEGKRIDWGAWGLKMTGAELQEFCKDWPDAAAAIATLDRDKAYVLAAAEGG